jgi:hypothetical protein
MKVVVALADEDTPVLEHEVVLELDSFDNSTETFQIGLRSFQEVQRSADDIDGFEGRRFDAFPGSERSKDQIVRDSRIKKTYSSSSSLSSSERTADIDRATLARAPLTALEIESVEGRLGSDGIESGEEGRLGMAGGEKLGIDGGEGIFGTLGRDGAFTFSFLTLGNGIVEISQRERTVSVQESGSRQD